MCNKPDQFGNTPLHYAALAGFIDVVGLYLMIPGVDVSTANQDGETVLDYAVGNSECVRVIMAKTLGLPRDRTFDGRGHAATNQTACRQAATAFINRLGNPDLWGAYEEITSSSGG